MHNHPSGDHTHSTEDIKVTEQIVEARSFQGGTVTAEGAENAEANRLLESVK